MKIKQVEELVGITRKNIRFYEEQGLLSPGRAENGYREYREADVERLKKIKLLRQLAVPIEEIKSVITEKKSLEASLQEHLNNLEEKRASLDQIGALSKKLIDSQVSFQKLDVDTCLDEVESLEKEGAKFMDLRSIDVRRKKEFGAAGGAIVMILLMGALIAFMIWGNSQDPLPHGLLSVMIGIPVVIIVGIIIALIERLREIEGGEEDEAIKY